MKIYFRKDHSLYFQAIQGFRETERKHFNKANTEIVNRIKDTSFDKEGNQLLYILIPFPIQLFTVQAKTVVFCHTLIS